MTFFFLLKKENGNPRRVRKENIKETQGIEPS